MEPWFGEFQFAYGCMRELEDGDIFFPGWGMPTLPTQVKEKELGYDAAFFDAPVAPVFLQYKVSDHLTRPTASEWPLFKRDYFRFGIYPRSRSPQHNRLVDLANKGKEVHYCAPWFSTAAEYAAFHAARSVSLNSAFIPCRNLPKNSGRVRHHIAYAKERPTGYFLSADEQRFVVIPGKVELVESVRQKVDRFLAPEAAIIWLTETLDVQLPTRSEDETDLQTISHNADRLSKAAMSMFGLALGFIRQCPLEQQGLLSLEV